MKNRVYCFTGTGNSLHVAQEVAKVLPDCDVVAIHKGMDFEVPQGLDRIGFVLPTYYWGLPAMAADFLGMAKYPKQGDTYHFAIATCAGMAGNVMPQTKDLLAAQGIKLNYSTSIRMVANAVFNYDMTADVSGATEKSNRKIQSVIPKIIGKKTNHTFSVNGLINRPYLKSIGTVHTFDKDFNVNDNCISCGICVSVCPAKNVTLENGKPQFHHHCESCTACIQHCPQKAINFKDQTQSRRRYTHPQVGYKEIRSYYAERGATG